MHVGVWLFNKIVNVNVKKNNSKTIMSNGGFVTKILARRYKVGLLPTYRKRSVTFRA